jgi:hypothetical protein
MKHLTRWAVVLILMQAVMVLAQKPELRVPLVRVGKATYSNAVLTASGTNRVAVEHPFGLGTIKTSDLDMPLAQQLLEAGVIKESALQRNTNYQAHLKQEKLAEKQRQRAANPQGPVAQYAGMDGSVGERLGSQLEREINARGGIDPERYVTMWGTGVVIAILGGAVFFYFLRCWCLFRIVRKSLGQGSWLVVLPLLRWFPLVRAAGMSRHLLLLPIFGLAMVYCQPPMPEKLPWAEAAYLFSTVGVWAITALLFAVWCVKICQKAGGSPLLGLLFIIPLLDWVPLLYLAFSGGGNMRAASASKNLSKPIRPVFAVG